ncbi:hypothetical protein AB1Y20_021127 [Prymnesium parvum]|uniref:GH16 domain-containing protein n=1 Tax=Prymnesium parvum TaxID=97485 RepID=A0AB34JIR1_PRYPA
MMALWAGAAAHDCCWCDKNTPESEMTTVGRDKATYDLVFSDEFNEEGRDFANGKDTKWTALKIGDTSNHGAAFYLPEQAKVGTDPNFTDISALVITTANKPFTGDGPEGETDVFMPYSSAMLQTWNKFCFTGGILEFRARQPLGAGYWPALWAFGNLGRAVYQPSNTGLWPWSYDECDADLELPPNDPPQRISACMDQPDDSGLHPFQGRGATELDVLEGAVSNDGEHSYVVGSLQLSPGLPKYFKPPMFTFPTREGAGSWYTGLSFGGDGLPNNGWYGPPWGSSCPTGCPDALSGGITEKNTLHSRYWLYRMEWIPGPEGHISWIYDGKFIWGMDASSFGEYSVCTKTNLGETCKRTPSRMIPQEPMSLVMNTAIGTWNGGAGALDGKHWPALFFIDYVRVYQKKEDTNVGCNPPDFPTKTYIEKNKELFGEWVTPTGYETCPEQYPDAAYKNAEAIKARAAKLRLVSVDQRTPQAYGFAGKAQVLLSLGTQQPASTVSSSRSVAPIAALLMVVVGVAGFTWRRASLASSYSAYTPSVLSSLTEPLAEDELSGEYQLAQEARP